MTKSASKKLKQMKGNDRAQRRAIKQLFDSEKGRLAKEKKVPIKRHNKARPWKAQSVQHVGGAVEPSPIPVLSVPLDRYPRDRISVVKPRKHVEVPPPIVVPLDGFRGIKPKKTPPKAKVAVPPPIVVPLDKFRRQIQSRNAKKTGTKLEVPPPIIVPLDGFHHSLQTRKKKASKPVVPAPIVVSLDGFGRSK